MRQKKPRLIVAFDTTTEAYAFENAATTAQVEGRLIPLPGSVAAGCGLAWSSPVEMKEPLDALIRTDHLAGKAPVEIQMYA